MKYYIGRLVLNDHDSNREYTSDLCIAANDEPQARALLEQRASTWGWSQGEKNAAGGYRFNEEGGIVVVHPYSVREVSPQTFDEMTALLHTVGPNDKAPVDGADMPETLKTLARRVGAQLKKLGIEAPQGKLLQALSASLDVVQWEVLKAKASGKRPAEWGTLPTGEYKGALRSAKSVEFSARVDAIWLTEGDVALAARLLRVHPEDLMASFEHAMDADTAFCGRHPDWLPEHSLSRDFGAKAEVGRTFEVRVERRYTNSYQVTGLVEGKEVIAFNNHISGEWHLAMCAVPNGDFSSVRRILACQEEALRRSLETIHAAV